ncbi:ATP-binding protein [Streptomyces antibioticus]|uniref:ATP-binding protein n=1 Tax=Streptomyces antibioticus TaxID=1890 RepID=UPI00369E6D9E
MTTTPLPHRRHHPEPRTAARRHHAFSLLLEHGPLAPATARHEARPVLAAWGLDDDQIYDALLVVSELVTNAVSHALPPVALHLRTSNGQAPVQVRVSDGGPQQAPDNWAASRPDDEHGRGDIIVSSLSGRAGTGETDGLVDHWATLAPAPAVPTADAS